MANDYFNASSPLTRHTLARAAQVNSIFDSVAAGLDKLPAADPLNQGRVTYVADTGAADAYVVTLAKAPSAYTAGLSIVMKAANTNTGASTIDVNSLGVKTIKRYNGDDLVANDIVAGALIHLVYDGTNFRIVGANGAESALAKEWATKTTAVSGGLKGARGYAQDASSSASAAATSEANAEGHFNTFRGVFYGALASDPATDPNGDPPDEGDWYYNTTTNTARLYDGSVWGDIGAATLSTFVFTATGGETSLSGDDDNGDTLSYTVGFIQVHLNGVLLTPEDEYTASDGSSITGLSAMSAGDVAVIDAFSRFNLSDAVEVATPSDDDIPVREAGAWSGKQPTAVRTLLGIDNHQLVTVDANANIHGYGQKIAVKSSDFTLAAADKGKTLECNKASAFTVTVPPNSSVALAVGYTVTLVQVGAGTVTVAQGAGVTVQSKDGNKSIDGQWAAATLYKRATDEWVLVGSLTA